MDQVRVALAWIKQYHFWLLCLLIVGVSLGCWYMASSDLIAQFKANQSKIDSEFSNQRSLQSRSLFPNEAVNSGQTNENTEVANRVQTIWQALYSRQREEVLKWPRSLGDDFISKVENEKVKFGDPISTAMRNRYQNYAKNSFKELPAIVDALEMKDDGNSRSGGAGGFGGGFSMPSPAMSLDGDEMIEQDFLVHWQDQLEVKQQLNFPKTPSAIEIWVTQEDLWVYRSLLQAIANTNKAAGADRNANAAVRVIYSMDIGPDAAKQNRAESRILVIESASADAGAPGGFGDFGGGAPGGFDRGGGGGFDDFGGGDPGGFGGGREMEGGAATLLAGRYVDEAGEPIPADSETYDFGVEFKRLPIRMALQMDRRWLNRLIIELANQPLQVEVSEVRINAGEADGSRGGSRSMNFESMSRSGGSNPFDGEILAFNREPAISQVIVSGIVYLFNAPDMSVLSTEDAEGDGLASNDF